MLPVMTVPAFLQNVGHTCGQFSVNSLLRVSWPGTLSNVALFALIVVV